MTSKPPLVLPASQSRNVNRVLRARLRLYNAEREFEMARTLWRAAYGGLTGAQKHEYERLWRLWEPQVPFRGAVRLQKPDRPPKRANRQPVPPEQPSEAPSGPGAPS